MSYREVNELSRSVSIVNWLWVGQSSNRGLISGRRQIHFSLLRALCVFGAHPASHPVGKGGYFSGVKWPECDANCALLSSTKV